MYGYDNYQKVKNEIEARRIAAIDASDARSAALRMENDEIKKIDSELVKTGLLIFKTACDGGDLTPIRERNLALSKRRTELIISLGYPSDYTDVKYTCEKCSDQGFVEGRMCSCFRELLLKENIKSSGIGNLIEKQSFENFDLSVYSAATKKLMEPMLLLAKSYAQDFSKESKNLLLIGKTGTGKTHISTAIAKVVIEKGYEVLYDTVQNIISAFEHDRFKSGYGPYDPKGDKYMDCDLLIIDDLGTEFVNQFTLACLYNLLNTRTNRGLPTVISTNLAKNKLEEKYEDRIYSRIIGGDTIQLTFFGDDRRIEAK